MLINLTITCEHTFVAISSTRTQYLHGKIVHENHITQHIIIQLHNSYHIHHSFIKKGKSCEKPNVIKEFPLPNHTIYNNIMSNLLLPYIFQQNSISSFNGCSSNALAFTSCLLPPKLCFSCTNSPNSY